MTTRLSGIFLLTALVASSSSPEKIQVSLVPKTLITTRLEAGIVKRRDRRHAIHELFAEAGCPAEEQPLNKKASNVICTLPGQSSAAIVVGGHFDFAEHGAGMVDDWSGTSLLPSLYQALKVRPRHHTYVFVAFDEEEVGLKGSSRYVKDLADSGESTVRAFVNLECLGLGPTNVWVHRSTPDLINRLGAVANAINSTIHGVNVEQVGDDDTHPFASAHIPVISVHSITQQTLPVLHSARDRLKAVHIDDYYDSYRLIAFYLAYLDTPTD